LISILLPVYNAIPYLKDCLDSILEQTATDWELLAIDDQSTDESWDILKAYAQKDDRIQCFQTIDKGIIPALRLAFDKSKGTLITRMDADDKMATNKLALLQEKLLQHGEGYVSTGLVKYFSTTTLGDGYRRYEEWINQLSIDDRHYEDLYRECVIASPCWMIHRSDLLKIGAFESNQYPEDYDLCFRFYKADFKIGAVYETLHFWRDHADRSSRNDPNYANQQYFNIKIPYFLTLDYDAQRPLVLWGAGKKGKQIARQLLEANTPFNWITNNPKKQGKEINGVILKSQQSLNQFTEPQLIVAIAGPDDQREIQEYFNEQGWKAGSDYFFFC